MFLQVVCSKAGKDKGSFSVVLSEDDNFVYIADGKLRKVVKPKRKNPKHLAFTKSFLTENDCESDSALRAALAKFNDKTGGI